MSPLAASGWIGLGGFLGANARWWVAQAVRGVVGDQWPWGIFLVNVGGSFLLGLLSTWGGGGLWANERWRLFLAIGFLGAYTTFSTFELETLTLAESGRALAAAGYVLASVGAALLAVWIGARLGR